MMYFPALNEMHEERKKKMQMGEKQAKKMKIQYKY